MLNYKNTKKLNIKQLSGDGFLIPFILRCNSKKGVVGKL